MTENLSINGLEDCTEVTAGDVRSQSIPVMANEEALALLRAGKPLSNVRLERLRFTGDFEHGISLNHVFLDRCVFQKVVFHRPVEMIGCTLSRVRFEREPMFAQNLSLRSCTVKRTVLGGITVQGFARFDRTTFASGSKFMHCNFEQGAKFWEARFEDWANFVHCRFADLADLRSVTACEGLSFEHCLFQKDFLLRGTSVQKKLDFGTSHFDGLLDLSKAKLHDFVYLESIGQGPRQQFAFANAVVDRMLVKPAQLQDRLHSEQTADYEAAMREYGLLKAVFQVLHRFDEEDWAYYRFKVCQRKSRPRSWKRPWTKLFQLCDLVFLDWGCGYGTNPVRAVLAALLMMFGFAVLYAIGYHHFEIDHAPLAEFPKDGLVNRTLYALMTTVSVFTSGFGGDQFNTAHGWVLIPLNIEALAGTLLWGLFVVAFSRKVIR